MSEKNYPPGAEVPAAAPAYPAQAPPAYPTQAGAYPTQPGQPVAQPAPALGTGYAAQPATGFQAQPGQPTTVFMAEQQDTRYRAGDVNKLRKVPAYPLCLCITFFAINCIIPGFGCWLGCIFVCGAHTIVKEDNLCSGICIAFGVGFLSLLTLPFGIGYILAIWWSMATIANNRLYYNNAISQSEIKESTTGPARMF